MRNIRSKIVLLLFVIGFSGEVWSYSSPALDRITRLSNESSVSYEEGIEALLELPNIFSSRNFGHIEFDHIEKNSSEQIIALQEWKTLYNEVHNKLFVLTHIARIRYQLSRMISNKYVFRRHRWQTEGRMLKAKIKRTQLQGLRQVLQTISAQDFDHSEHQFGTLSDLGKINTEGLISVEGSEVDTFSFGVSKSFSKGFSKSFSKGFSKGNYNVNATDYRTDYWNDLVGRFGEEHLVRRFGGENDDRFLDYINRIDRWNDLERFFGRESLVELYGGEHDDRFRDYVKIATKKAEFRKIRDYSQSFVFRYNKAKVFDMSYRDVPLSQPAVQFLNRLEIEDHPPYFTDKNLSHFYRTAPPSQAKSNACVGFALASDMEFELQRTHQLRREETLSPFSVYAALRYQEEVMPSPDCLGLHSLSDTIAEGQWAMDIGIAILDFTNIEFCLTSSSGGAINHTAYVSIKNMEMYDGEITFALLKAMIDHKKPPVLIIRSDAREETEDWINITENGRFAHVFVVVGYGRKDIDPFTLRSGPYFLVRDSLASRPIHYKVSAQDLLDNSLAVLKVSQLERY